MRITIAKSAKNAFKTTPEATVLRSGEVSESEPKKALLLLCKGNHNGLNSK